MWARHDTKATSVTRLGPMRDDKNEAKVTEDDGTNARRVTCACDVAWLLLQ